MFELDDVGKEVHVRVTRIYTDCDIDAKIAMVIKAPRGTLALFQREDDNKYNRHIGDTPIECKCRAIKAFMEEHSDE